MPQCVPPLNVYFERFPFCFLLQQRLHLRTEQQHQPKRIIRLMVRALQWRWCST